MKYPKKEVEKKYEVGEGFDIDIETSQRQRFQLSWGQYEALKHLVNIIENK